MVFMIDCMVLHCVCVCVNNILSTCVLHVLSVLQTVSASDRVVDCADKEVLSLSLHT